MDNSLRNHSVIVWGRKEEGVCSKLKCFIDYVTSFIMVFGDPIRLFIDGGNLRSLLLNILSLKSETELGWVLSFIVLGFLNSVYGSLIMGLLIPLYYMYW